MKDSAEEKLLTQRYTHQLNQQETRLEILRRGQAELEGKRRQAQEELAAMIQQASLDVKL